MIENLRVLKGTNGKVVRCVGCRSMILVAYVPNVFVIEEAKLACTPKCIDRYNESEEGRAELRSRE